MNHIHLLKLVLAVSVPSLLVVLLLLLYLRQRKRSFSSSGGHHEDAENGTSTGGRNYEEGQQAEDLMRFQGGEGLTVSEILDAPGEVVGKSSYGTLYKALLQAGDGNSVKLLRFLRPVCAVDEPEEFGEVIRFLGCVRYHNLVPLLGFYRGRRGEKLLIHPFYRSGNLADFIRDNGEPLKSSVIYRISMGIARGLDHLHTGLQRPIIHGNLKSKNVLLDRNWEPCVSDFGLHLLLNPASGQQMLEALSAEGYKAPELMKIKEVNEGSDIFSLGVILLELLTRTQPINEAASPDEELYLPNYVRNAVLEKRISELYRPNMVRSKDSEEEANAVIEEGILKLFKLAMACCSPSPSLRPNTRQVLRHLEEISK